MKCCNSNPFVPQPHNVIWLCDGKEIPDGWIETSRFDFGCVSAVSVWPAGMDVPDYDVTVVEVTGGVVSSFTRGGTSFTQIIYRQSGSISISGKTLSISTYSLGAGGGSTGSGFNRGGGGAGQVLNGSDIPMGVYDISIGAGGAAGAAGSPSALSVGGVIFINCQGGGVGGSGGAVGGNGGNGGGAGGNAGSRLGGVGAQNNGGASGGLDITPGGGGGAGGLGLSGGPASGMGGNGGPGLDLLWTEPPLQVGGGGGAGGTGTPGTATHGGSSGTNTTPPLDADWSGGAGGSRSNSVVQAKGGDGFFVIVFPSEGVLVL